MADFDEIWYGHYAIGGWSKLVLFNFVHSLAPKQRIVKLVRQDETAHAFLRMPVGPTLG
jgi:hypothetical protein